MNPIFPALFLSFLALSLSAQPEGLDNVEIKTTHVAGSVYMLEGRGGNIGISVGGGGVIMIDDQYAPLTDKIVSAIKEITDQPIRFVVNTHLHPDHTGGNENLGAMGAHIVAHDLVRERLKNRTMNRETGIYGPGTEAGGLPAITYNDTLTFHFNGEEIRVIKAPAAHTDGDCIVHFTGSNVIHMGDVYRTTTYPYIDVNHGGSFRGTLDALAFAIRLADDDTIIIPGHGVLSNKMEMEAWRKMLATIANRIRQSVEKGEALEEALARNPGLEFNGRWGADSGLVTTKSFMTLIYHELSKH